MKKANDNKKDNFKEILNLPEVRERIADFADALVVDINHLLDSDAEEVFLEKAKCAYLVNATAERELKPLGLRYIATVYDEINKFKAMFKAIGYEIKSMDINDLDQMEFTVDEEDGSLNGPTLKFADDGTIIDYGFFANSMLGNYIMLEDIIELIGHLKKYITRFECPDDLIKALQRADNADYDILNVISRYVPCTFPDGSDNSQIRMAMIMMNIDPDFEPSPAVLSEYYL